MTPRATVLRDPRSLRRAATRGAPLALALAGCTATVLDQRLYEDPDARGVQATQVLLRGAPLEDSPPAANVVGYNAYRDTRAEQPAQAVLLLIPEWGWGAGWFDALARDVVAAFPQLEVWTLNRRQVLLHGWPTTEPPAFLRSWGLDVALSDLDLVVERAEDLGLPVVLGGFGTGGGLLALHHAVTRHARAPAARGLLLFDVALGPNNERDRRDIEEGCAFIRNAFESGVLAMPFLNPRLQVDTGDLLLLVQAAELAEAHPDEPSPLAPHLAQDSPPLPPGTWTNDAVFAWLLHRGDSPATHPLGHVFGFPFAELALPRDAQDDARVTHPPHLRYGREQALLPFRAPGGAVESWPPLRYWADLATRLGSTSFVEIHGLERLRPRRGIPWLYVASAALRAHWDALEMERGTAGVPREVERLGRALGNAGEDVLLHDGDFHAPLLDRATRALVIDALAPFLDRALVRP